jgi:hypothetical protein
MVLVDGPRGIATPDLTRAGALPRLDTEAFMAPAQGLATLGKGIAQAGDYLSDLAERKAQADAIVQEQAAETAHATALYEIEAATAQEPNQDKWQGIADSRLKQLRAELDKMTLQPLVRQRVNSQFEKWEADAKGKLSVRAAGASFQKAGAAINEQIATATRNKNIAEVERLAHAKAASGFDIPESVPNIIADARLKIEHQEENEQKESILGAIRRDPDEALSILQNDKFAVKESVRAWGINAAQQGIREKLSTLTQETQDEVAKGLAGNLATPEAVDDWAKTHPGFSPEMVMVTKGHINRMNSARHQQYVAQHGPEMASVLDSEISAFDRTDANAKLDYFHLRTRIDELPGELRAPLYKELDAALSGKPPQVDKTIAAMGRQLTGSMLKEGKFGKYLDPVMVLDASGKATDRQAVNQNGIPQWKINQERWRAAVEQRAKVDVDFQRWLERNPKATPEQAAAAVNTIKPNATRANAWDAMFGPWQQPPTDETYQPKGARRHEPPKAEPAPEADPEPKRKGSADYSKPELPSTEGGLDENTLLPDAPPEGLENPDDILNR